MDTTRPVSDAGSSTVPAKQSSLQGRLGVVSIVFTVLAFNAPLGVAAGFVPIVIGAGNRDGAPATFLVIAALLLIFAVGLLAMSRHMTSPGAFYSYITAGLGRVPGLSGAFTAIGAYTAFVWCSLVFGGILTGSMVTGLLDGPDLPWWVWSAALWVVCSTFSVLHVELSARVLGVALCAEVLVTVVWGLRVFFTGGEHGVSLHPFTPAAFGSGSLGVGLLFGALCITGFEAVAVFREETRDPVRTVPRATYASVIFMCVLYGFAAWAFLTAYGDRAVAEATADPAGAFVSSVSQYAGTVTSDLVTILLVSSAFASILANQNIAARYLYSLGSDGVLPRRLGRVHPTQGSPYVAAATFAGISLVGIIFPAVAHLDPLRMYAAAAAFGSVCLLALMFMTSLAVLRFFRGIEHRANRWQAQIAPVVSLMGMGAVLVLAVTHMPDILGSGRAAANLALGVIVLVATGGAGLAMFYRRWRPEVYARIGRQDLSQLRSERAGSDR